MIYFPAGFVACQLTHAIVQTFAKTALVTAYPYVIGKRPPGCFKHIADTLADRPVIVDSGMFSIQGEVWTGRDPAHYAYKSSDYMRRYIDRYTEVLAKSNFNGYVVECDCNLLTREWEKDIEYGRGVLKSAFGDRVIYVWHYVDGISALKSLIGGVKRIAISEPSLRTTLDIPDPIRNTLQLIDIKADQHLHILGTGNFNLAYLPDNYSIDSSTWSMVSRFGRSMPDNPYAVYWWRRKKLEAIPSVIEEVDASMDLCKSRVIASALNRHKHRKIDEGYVRAMACALVSTQRYYAAQRKHYDHPENGVVVGPWQKSPTRGTERKNGVRSKA